MSRMIEVTQEDANNYCRVLTALGMEEEGDPVAEIERLRAAVAAERERCAQMCEDISDEYQRTEGRRYPELKSDAQTGADACAAAIRRTTQDTAT